MPRLLQAELLHVLQDLRFKRVGGGGELIRAGVGVIATTNRDLETALQNGDFRADLYRRLNVVELPYRRLRTTGNHRRLGRVLPGPIPRAVQSPPDPAVRDSGLFGHLPMVRQRESAAAGLMPPRSSAMP